MMEEINCDNCGGKKWSENDEIGSVKTNTPYSSTTPIQFIDHTMQLSERCGCCGESKYYSTLTQHKYFCSYECFWEWSNKNIPHEDKTPKERLTIMNDERGVIKLLKDKILGENDGTNWSN
jgi:hypothetical protein